MSGEVGIGIVGYGIMGKAHSYGYTVAPVMRRLRHRPRLRVISGRDKQKVDAAAVAYGVDGSVTDWRELVRRPEVDIVDICTPPGTHAETAIAVAVPVHAYVFAGGLPSPTRRLPPRLTPPAKPGFSTPLDSTTAACRPCP